MYRYDHIVYPSLNSDDEDLLDLSDLYTSHEDLLRRTMELVSTY